MRPYNDADVTRLALAFSRELGQELLPEEMAAVVSRNAGEESPGVCHSHDFCDANMTMLRAFESTFGREPDLESDADTGVWERAWSAAMADRFGLKV